MWQGRLSSLPSGNIHKYFSLLFIFSIDVEWLIKLVLCWLNIFLVPVTICSCLWGPSFTPGPSFLTRQPKSVISFLERGERSFVSRHWHLFDPLTALSLQSLKQPVELVFSFFLTIALPSTHETQWNGVTAAVTQACVLFVQPASVHTLIIQAIQEIVL